jgi:hypothetical protein
MSEEITAEDRVAMFEFLDELRESGAINMLGAAPELAEAFDLDKYTAREVCSEWRKSFPRD